jgi:hypothetical protein
MRRYPLHAYPLNSARVEAWLDRTSLARSSSSSTAFPMRTRAGSTCLSRGGRRDSGALVAGARRQPACRGGCCGSARPAVIRSR